MTPNQAKADFIQATAFVFDNKIRRAASSIPPRWRAWSDRPGNGTGRRFGQWQQPEPPLSVSGVTSSITGGRGVRPGVRKRMSESFKSHFPQKVDSKARVSIPAVYRRVLEAGDPNYSATSRPRVAIVYGGDNRAYLECFTITDMRAMERRIRRMPTGDKRRAYLAHNVITLSTEIDIDDEGRIVLPQPARDKIGMANLKDGAEAVFAGTVDAFRIWHRDDWEADRASQRAIAEALLAPGEDMLSLLPADLEPED